MAKLYLVGGSSVNSLSEYLQKKGSFEVIGSVESLSREEELIKQKTIFADKLIILLTDRTMKVRQEFYSLRNLLFDRSYFEFSELYVFVRSDDPELQDVPLILQKLAEQVDKTPHLTPIDIHLISDQTEYGFEAVYDQIIGTTYIDNLENQRLARVRRKVGESAKNAYEPQPTNLVFKPYDFNNLLNFEEVQRNAYLADDGNRIIESENKYQKSGEEVPHIEKPTGHRCEVYVLAGDKSSGKSLLGTALALSAVATDGKKVAFVDMKQKSIYPKIFEQGMGAQIPYSKMTLAELFCFDKRFPNKYSFTLVDGVYGKYKQAHLLTLLDKIDEAPYDVMIVEMSMEDAIELRPVIESFVSLFIYLCPCREMDVKEVGKVLEKNIMGTLVSLTGFMPSTKFNQRMDLKAVKQTLGLETKIMAPINLKDLEVPRELYRKIKGVWANG